MSFITQITVVAVILYLNLMRCITSALCCQTDLNFRCSYSKNKTYTAAICNAHLFQFDVIPYDYNT